MPGFSYLGIFLFISARFSVFASKSGKLEREKKHESVLVIFYIIVAWIYSKLPEMSRPWDLRFWVGEKMLS